MRERAAEQLILEVEAFLDGHVGEVLVGLPVSDASWVPVNWIAHATPDELLASAYRDDPPTAPWGSWPWAIDTVLRELVAAADAQGHRVMALQRACLIPYELALLTPQEWATTPFDVVAEVVSEIRNYRPDGGED